MKGPDFITLDGARRALEWERLRSSAEVNLPIPSRPWPPQPQPRLRPRLHVGGVVIERGQKKPLDPGEWDDIPPPPWGPEQLGEMEVAASEILRRHCYPMVDGLTLWRWLPQGLCWTHHPGPNGRLDGEELPLSWMDRGSIAARCDSRFDEAWPADSSLRWAERVYQLAGQYRQARAVIKDGEEDERAGGAFSAFEAGYHLGLGIGSAEAGARLDAAKAEAVKQAKSDQAVANSSKGNAVQAEERRIRRKHWVAMVPEFYDPTAPTLRPWTLDRLAHLIFEEERLPPHPDDWKRRDPEAQSKWNDRNLGSHAQILAYLVKAIAEGDPGTEAFKHLPTK